MHRGLMLLILTLALLAPVRAAENTGMVEVVAQGMGVDSDGALKNALRAAVQQAVGTMIDAKTMVENDEVIRDRILSHSGGYVVKYDMIGDPKNDGGLVTVRIHAVVKSHELRQKLESEKIITVAFDGKDLSAEMFTRRLQSESAADILPTLFEGFPADFLSVRMEGEPKVDKEKNQFIVPVRVELNLAKTKAFIKRLDDFFTTASDKKADISRVTVNASNGKISLTNWSFSKKCIHLMTSLNSARTNAIVKSYPVTPDTLSFFATAFAKEPYVSIDLVDNDGEPIMGKNVRIPRPIRLYNHDGIVMLVPFLYSNGYMYYEFEPAQESALYTIAFDISPDEVADINNVKMEIMIE